MAGLVFSEESFINENLFKFEERLKSRVSKYISEGVILSTYFSQSENSTTVDRGTNDIDKIFGSKSPLRFIKINNLPLSQFPAATPDNTDEQQIEDINIEGDCVILPGTIVPKPLDFFMLNHIKMRALFEVTSVQYDSMKVEGYYKIHFRLYSTSDETIQHLLKQVIEVDHTDLNVIGSNMNPIIREDDYVLRGKIEQMVNKMIESYRALFYNQRHNCFLYHDLETGIDYFDLCGNEFIAKYSLVNFYNSTNVIVLHEKIKDVQMPYWYNNSVYSWLELDAPVRLVQKFHYILSYAEGYPESSFARWGDGDVQLMHPIPTQHAGINNQEFSFFDDIQLQSFLDSINEPTGSEFDKLIWKFIHRGTSLSIHDVSLYTADTLISSVKHMDVYLYTPIVIYIIRKILQMN